VKGFFGRVWDEVEKTLRFAIESLSQ